MNIYGGAELLRAAGWKSVWTNKRIPQLFHFISSKVYLRSDSFQAKLQHVFNSILTGEQRIWLNTHTEVLHLAEMLYEWSALGEGFVCQYCLPIVSFQAVMQRIKPTSEAKSEPSLPLSELNPPVCVSNIHAVNYRRKHAWHTHCKMACSCHLASSSILLSLCGCLPLYSQQCLLMQLGICSPLSPPAALYPPSLPPCIISGQNCFLLFLFLINFLLPLSLIWTQIEMKYTYHKLF